jgi:DnaJ-class molecular chaperone
MEDKKEVIKKSKPCKSCGGLKGRSGWYCEPCREKAEFERKRKSGSKPHYIKVPCSDCAGVRDRKGYLCSNCHLERQNIRKDIIRKYRDEYRSLAIEEIKKKRNQKREEKINL